MNQQERKRMEGSGWGGRGPENKLPEEGKGGTFRSTSDGIRYSFLRKEERMGFK